MSKKDKKTIFTNSLADYSAALRQHPASPVFTQAPLALSQKHTLISQNWNLLSWSFTNSGLIQRFIMQPILDGLRGGLTITSKQKIGLPNVKPRRNVRKMRFATFICMSSLRE